MVGVESVSLPSLGAADVAAAAAVVGVAAVAVVDGGRITDTLEIDLGVMDPVRWWGVADDHPPVLDIAWLFNRSSPTKKRDRWPEEGSGEGDISDDGDGGTLGECGRALLLIIIKSTKLFWGVLLGSHQWV